MSSETPPDPLPEEWADAPPLSRFQRLRRDLLKAWLVSMALIFIGLVIPHPLGQSMSRGATFFVMVLPVAILLTSRRGLYIALILIGITVLLLFCVGSSCVYPK